MTARLKALLCLEGKRVFHRPRPLWRGGRARYFFALTFATAGK